MCSGCSGDYENGADWERERRNGPSRSGTNRRADGGPSGGSWAGSSIGGQREPESEYEVFVSDQRILEIHKSPYFLRVSQHSTMATESLSAWAESQGLREHSRASSAKHYATRCARAWVEAGRLTLSAMPFLGKGLATLWSVFGARFGAVRHSESRQTNVTRAR